MIFEHYIIILLWGFGGEVTINHLKLAYQREYDWIDEIAFLFLYIVWPFVVAIGIIRRVFK